MIDLITIQCPLTAESHSCAPFATIWQQGDKRKEVYGAAMPTGTALTETNYFHGFQSHQCEVCADDLTLLRVVVRVPASSGMLRKEQKLER